MAYSLWRKTVAVGLTAGFAGAICATSVMAQNGPAEVPPASYAGDQYVDSAGCVFVRVGVGSATQWVPRVGPDRAQICGQSPSGAGAPTVVADVAADPGVEVIGGGGGAAPAPTAAAYGNVPVISPYDTTGYATGYAVAPVQIVPRASVTATPTTGVPRSFALSQPPEGYRPAWEDGRLNPYRGLGTESGAAQMAQVWTDTVPRRLVAVPVPVGTTAAVGGYSGLTAPVTQAPNVDRSRAPTPAAAAAPETAVRVGAGHRHVLAGSYAAQADAVAAYHRLASLGLPVEVRRRGAAEFQVVAGPYGDPQALGQAVVTARNAGFAGATTRN